METRIVEIAERIKGLREMMDITPEEMAEAAGVELEEYLKQREEALKRDHNKLGRELEYFTTVDVIGQGLPVLLPGHLFHQQNKQGLLPGLLTVVHIASTSFRRFRFPGNPSI